MQNQTTKRLFFALWPDETTRQKCCEVMARLGDHGKGKPVAEQNLHVTLVFLGNVNSLQQQAICRAADDLPVLPMTLQFDQLRFWRKPAIGCLTARLTDPAIVTLAGQLTEIAKSQGIAIDQRPYTPHVTLFRKLTALLPGEFPPIPWHADDFCLVESCASDHGVIYRILERWPKPD